MLTNAEWISSNIEPLNITGNINMNFPKLFLLLITNCLGKASKNGYFTIRLSVGWGGVSPMDADLQQM